MSKNLKCPVCGKPLSQKEFDKALGLWDEKEEHIKHLEDERKKLKELEKANREKLKEEQKKLRLQQSKFKHQMQQQVKDFKLEQNQIKKDFDRLIREQNKQSDIKLKKQKDEFVKTFNDKLNSQVKKQVDSNLKEQKRQLKKQETDLKASKNKMAQLEKSLKLSAEKYDTANAEIKKLKEQIEKGITPQIEGLLEEKILLAKLRELFPYDDFQHTGKGGDILQTVIEQGKEIGKIVYECKKVKTFSNSHVEQAKIARNQRQADFAILVTNVFPKKKQYYFVDKNVFVISPLNLEPITFTLRESLVKIALLKISNAAKEKAVQKVYDYLSGSDYNNRMNTVANQLIDLGIELKKEIISHKNTWKKRYKVYQFMYNDIGMIDYRLKELVHHGLNHKKDMLALPQKKYLQIEELNG
ncbi:MAG: DUF2130 domain-containing protein [Ignavibacteria bacterium]|nr:DUF2130 domain-containing protein [Ignavibacteria bacterium]